MNSITINFIRNISAIVILGCVASPIFAAENLFANSDRYGKVTPTDVFSILTDYENLFMYYAKTHKKGLISKIKAVELRPVSGKTPDIAFNKLHQLSDSVDKLLSKSNLKKSARTKRQKATAVPAEVYAQTGNILDALTELMVKLEPGKNWGDFYQINTFKKGKKPDDVYALADLSIRRLNVILR